MNALMTQFDSEHAEPQRSQKWEGFSEIDEAVRDNRVIEYRWKKTWADPWARRLGIVVLSLFGIFAGFVIYWEVLRG